MSTYTYTCSECGRIIASDLDMMIHRCNKCAPRPQEAQAEPLSEAEQLIHDRRVDIGTARVLRKQAERIRALEGENASFARALGQDSEPLREEMTRRREAFRSVLLRAERAEAHNRALIEVLTALVSVIDAAGLLNLSNGVQLGPTSWYVKASDVLDSARAALAQGLGSKRTT